MVNRNERLCALPVEKKTFRTLNPPFDLQNLQSLVPLRPVM